MKAMLVTLFCLAPTLQAGGPPGCAAAVELFRRYAAVELQPDQFSLFAASATIRLYGETADGQDLGHKDLLLEEYRALAPQRRPGRYSRVRCEPDGLNWLITAQRQGIKKNASAPVSLLVGEQNGQLRILSASYVQIAD